MARRAFLWSYYSFADPMAGTGGVSWTDYTTQHKPANNDHHRPLFEPGHVTGLVWNGTASADKIDGGYHNDTLNGGGGNDTSGAARASDNIVGGDGDDVYEVVDAGDIVVEDAGPSERQRYGPIEHRLSNSAPMSRTSQLVGRLRTTAPGTVSPTDCRQRRGQSPRGRRRQRHHRRRRRQQHGCVLGCARSDYAVSHSGNGGYAVTGPDGIDRIRNIQFVKFAGQ